MLVTSWSRASVSDAVRRAVAAAARERAEIRAVRIVEARTDRHADGATIHRVIIELADGSGDATAGSD